jgi:RNA-directed DNA polymerase
MGKIARQIKAQHYPESTFVDIAGAGGMCIICTDLSQFFDRVNHVRLMKRLTEKVTDRRVLTLIRKYLQAGVLSEGICAKRCQP